MHRSYAGLPRSPTANDQFRPSAGCPLALADSNHAQSTLTVDGRSPTLLLFHGTVHRVGVEAVVYTRAPGETCPVPSKAS